MTVSFQDRLSQLFREIEIDVGSTNMSILVLESFEEAVQDLRGRDLHEFFLQLLDLNHDINNTEPKFAILMDGFYEILKLAYEEEIHHPKTHFPLRKRKFLKRFRELIRSKRYEELEIIKNAMKIDVEGRQILLHDNSRTVQRVLQGFQREGKHFRVIVAEQDPDKSGPVIESLHKNKISFRVVPSYMVTHLDKQIDMFFLGGVTLKSTMDFVMDPGTNALVSQFHLAKVPLYTFISTSKFSMWKAKKRTEVYTHVHRRKHHCKPIDFERIKFSHDRVPMKLMNKIVTECGVFTPKQIEKFFEKKLKERLQIMKQFEKKLEKVK